MKPETKEAWKAVYNEIFSSEIEKGVLFACTILLFATLIPIYPLNKSVDPLLLLDYKNGNIIYGILWVWLNPLYWTQLPYQVYLLAIQAVVITIEWKLMRMGKIRKHIFYLSFIQQIIWRMYPNYQNITVTIFAPLATISPLLSLLPILQKIPLGWSFPDVAANPHWQCAFGSGGTAWTACPSVSGILIEMFSPRWNYRFDFYLLAFWIIYPVVVWWKRRHRK